MNDRLFIVPDDHRSVIMDAPSPPERPQQVQEKAIAWAQNIDPQDPYMLQMFDIWVAH